MDALGIVPFPITYALEILGTVCLPQKISALLRIVALHEIRINFQLALRNSGTARQDVVKLTLRDKAGPRGLKAVYGVKVDVRAEQ